MSATSERDMVCRLAKTDFERALTLARKVSLPWFRCQALAYVARYAPEKQVVPRAKEAIKEAFSDSNIYTQVAATAWPLRALIEREQAKVALEMLPQILALYPRIEPPISRGDAVFLLWEALFPLGGEARKSMTDTLVASCIGHKKGWWILREATLTLASEDLKAAHRLAALIPNEKYKRQAETRLAEGRKFRARSFFHS